MLHPAPPLAAAVQRRPVPAPAVCEGAEQRKRQREHLLSRETAAQALARHCGPAVALRKCSEVLSEAAEAAERAEWKGSFERLAHGLLADWDAVRAHEARITDCARGAGAGLGPRERRGGQGGGTQAARARVRAAAAHWDRLCEAADAAAASAAAASAARLRRAGWTQQAEAVWAPHASAQPAPGPAQEYTTNLPGCRDASDPLSPRSTAAVVPRLTGLAAGVADRFVLWTATSYAGGEPEDGAAAGERERTQLWLHDAGDARVPPGFARPLAAPLCRPLDGNGWGTPHFATATADPAAQGVIVAAPSQVSWAPLSARAPRSPGELVSSVAIGRTALHRDGDVWEVGDVAVRPDRAAAFCTVCIRCRGGAGDPECALAAFDIAADAADGAAPLHIVARGDGCYASPCVSPCGGFLAWTAWHAPGTAIEGSRLCAAQINADGSLNHRWTVDGGGGGAVMSPCFTPQGDLAWLTRAGQGAWSLSVSRRRAGDPDSPRAQPYAPSRSPVCVGQLRCWGGGSGHVLCAMPHAAAGTIVAVASNEDVDVLMVYDTETALSEFRVELAGAGATRLWSPCAIDARRVALLAAGAGLPPLPLVYDLSFRTVVALGPSRPPLPLASAPRLLRLPRQRRSQRDQVLTESPAWVFVPPRGARPAVPATCGEAPRKDEMPLIIEAHTCWGAGAGWSADCWDPATQVLCSHGFVVLHVVVPGALQHGDALRDAGAHVWKVAAPEAIISAVLACSEVLPIDLSHVCARGSSIDALVALRAAAARGSFIRACVAHGIVPDVARWAEDRPVCDAGWAASLLDPPTGRRRAKGDAREEPGDPWAEGVRCPCLLLHSVGDRASPLPAVEAFAARLQRTNHAPVTLRTVPGELHPPHPADALPAELEFVCSAMWDPG